MKRTLIALFATAALAIPAVAQQQDPNQKSDQNASQDQNKGQDQNAGQNAPDPSANMQSAQSGSIHLTRAQTRMLQQALNSGGLDAGPADGRVLRKDAAHGSRGLGLLTMRADAVVNARSPHGEEAEGRLEPWAASF